MRLSPPPTDAPPLRWVPLAALPVPLRAAASARGALEPVRGPLGAWWHPTFTWGRALPLQALGFGAGACAIAASDAAARWVASFLLAGAAGWAAWWLDRPCAGLACEPGLGALLSSSALVLVDRDAVAVVGGEHLERRGDRWWYGDALLDEAPHPAAWNDALAEVALRARTDPDALAGDTWRPLAAPIAGRGSLLAARWPHAARVAAAAFAALALTAGVARRKVEAPAKAAAGVAEGDARTSADVLGETDRALSSDERALAVADSSAADAAARAALEREGRRLREATEAGDERALRTLLRAPGAYGLSEGDVQALRGRLEVWCTERFGLSPGDEGLRAVVRVALELRCVDPGEALPLWVVATGCRSGTSRCREVPAEERRDRRESVNATPVRGTAGPALVGTVFQRVDLVNRAGRGVGRLVQPHTTVAFFPLDALDAPPSWWR